MRTLSNNDYNLFERIVKLNETQLLTLMTHFLKQHYSDITFTKDYIYAKGDVPIAMLAHMDTVFAQPPKHIYYDTRKGVIWSPEGLGADDRAGVFAIIKVIKQGYHPTIILTTGEEIGGIGARKFVNDFPNPPENIRYLLQIDRQGSVDCVFYNCANQEFTDYISSFGFVEDWGTFTDISTICPRWKIAGVNLSIGYINEHSVSETFHVNYFLNTIEKIYKMLEDSHNLSKSFEYIYDTTSYAGWFSQEWYTCKKCGETCLEHEAFPVKTSNGKVEHYCPECIVEVGDWCPICGEPFKIEFPEQKVCSTCLKNGKKEEKIKCQ